MPFAGRNGVKKQARDSRILWRRSLDILIIVQAASDIATCMYYTGIDPFTKQEVYGARHLIGYGPSPSGGASVAIHIPFEPAPLQVLKETA